MTNRFLISAATLALIAGTGFANAQGTGMSREQEGATVQQSAPSAGNSAAPANREATEPSGASSGMEATQSDERSPAAGKKQRAQDNAQDEKSKRMSSENETKAGDKEMKPEGRNGNMKAEGREGRDANEGREGRDTNMNAESREGRSQITTGQAGSGAKLSTEQRTKITTVIRDQHVAPVNNVSFSIAIGTRVPHESATFHPLPSEVVTIYPQWRGYQFILIRDQIVVVDPATFEIVAILEA
jgi:hypothetical protein